MEKWNTLTGKRVALTGAGSGIGRALAMALSEERCELALADLNTAGLEETRGLLTGSGRVSTTALDVADREAFQAWAEQVKTEFGGAPDIVINNAGVALVSQGKDMAFDDLEWVMGINFNGVVHGTRFFLPAMVERDAGQIVNVSSVFGLFGVATQGAYCASKFAVRGYSESIRCELHGTNVGMTVVHPGGVRTNIVRSARFKVQDPEAPTSDEVIERFDTNVRSTPEQAAQTIIKGIKKRKARVLVGPDAKIIDIGQRLFPTKFPIWGRDILTGRAEQAKQEKPAKEGQAAGRARR